MTVERRDKIVKLRLSEAEHARLAARSGDVAMAAWARACLLDDRPALPSADVVRALTRAQEELAGLRGDLSGLEFDRLGAAAVLPALERTEAALLRIARAPFGSASVILEPLR